MNEQKVLEKARAYLAAYKKWHKSEKDNHEKLYWGLVNTKNELLGAIIEEEKEN